jgi:hypothetical protein
MDHTDIVSKSEFARLLGVSRGRVSQWLASGQIGGDALVGSGRLARIRVAAAAARLNPSLRGARPMSLRSVVGCQPPAAPCSPDDEPFFRFHLRVTAEDIPSRTRRELLAIMKNLLFPAPQKAPQTERNQLIRAALDLYSGPATCCARALAHDLLAFVRAAAYGEPLAPIVSEKRAALHRLTAAGAHKLGWRRLHDIGCGRP